MTREDITKVLTTESFFDLLKINLGLLAGLFILSGCVSNPEIPPNAEYTKTFNVPHEQVWRALQQTFISYPMDINNMELGHLKTLNISGAGGYRAPHKKNKFLPQGYKYKLDVHILKEKKNRTKVNISKNVFMEKDFFSAPVDLKSDGFEEQALLYRLQRELFIEKLLRKEEKKEKKEKGEKINLKKERNSTVFSSAVEVLDIGPSNSSHPY